MFGGYVITFYYTIILAWACIYFVESFQGTDSIPWAKDAATHFDNVSMCKSDCDYWLMNFRKYYLVTSHDCTNV